MVNAFDTSSMFPAHPIKYTKRTDVITVIGGKTCN